MVQREQLLQHVCDEPQPLVQLSYLWGQEQRLWVWMRLFRVKGKSGVSGAEDGTLENSSILRVEGAQREDWEGECRL